MRDLYVDLSADPCLALRKEVKRQGNNALGAVLNWNNTVFSIATFDFCKHIAYRLNWNKLSAVTELVTRCAVAERAFRAKVSNSHRCFQRTASRDNLAKNGLYCITGKRPWVVCQQSLKNLHFTVGGKKLPCRTGFSETNFLCELSTIREKT